MFLVYTIMPAQLEGSISDFSREKYCVLIFARVWVVNTRGAQNSICLRFLTITESIIDWKLKLRTEAPLSYVNQLVAWIRKQILFSVEITCRSLWKASELHFQRLNEYLNYIDLLNSTVTDGWFVANVSNNCFVMQCSYHQGWKKYSTFLDRKRT